MPVHKVINCFSAIPVGEPNLNPRSLLNSPMDGGEGVRAGCMRIRCPSTQRAHV
ncbi:hypothetical protein YC2023_098340 [Brassica napus]